MQQLHKSVYRRVFILALGLILISGGPCLAARYVPITITVDGRPALKGGTGDNGNADPDVVWRYLKNAKLQPIGDYRVERDSQDPLRATLTGKIILEVSYAGRADLSELKLIRGDEGGTWKVAPDEIERTFKTRHKPFSFRISLAGQPTLWTKQRTRRGQKEDTRDNVWGELKRETIYGKKIDPNFRDPLRATLKGGVVIKLTYADESWGQAELPQLKLTRDKPNTLWKVDPEELESILQNRTDSE
ncbi:MAG TPA: hypothetical protein VGP76_29270 [Planctomycetaceae bacterium]|jgi:hypothetical protein|nr:hypothetical protein [Planctomycetaceae bacterium]